MIRNTIRTGTSLTAFSLLVLVACGSSGDASGETTAATTTEHPAASTGAATNVYGDSMPHPTVTLSTTLGEIRIELFPEDAPASVENFLAYVESGFYDGLIFHRVIPGFMAQAGGHEPDMAQREAGRDPIQNESDNGLKNLRSTVAMARTASPHSARAQFFINLVDNAQLNHRGGDNGWGYAVFGRVIDGMDVVDAIAGKPTHSVGAYENVPVEPIVIESAVRGEDIQPAE